MTQRTAIRRPDPVSPVQLLEELVETYKDYASGAIAKNTAQAYASDWRHYAS